MNRAFYIILVPALLVAIGYVVVFRAMGVSGSYWRLILPLGILGAVMWWLGRGKAPKADSNAR